MSAYLHMAPCLSLPQKKADYCSLTAERIFTLNTKKKEKGYYGLPTALEVGQDLIVQIPENEMLQALEIEQYWYADEVPSELGIENGHHINFYLKNSFIEQRKNERS